LEDFLSRLKYSVSKFLKFTYIGVVIGDIHKTFPVKKITKQWKHFQMFVLKILSS
jgi:hypothetical protein